jgi:glycosyltransferase involved in cell wall biosynthesis
MTKHKLALIVPTMDREKDLRVMLDSFIAQTVQIDQIVIVDGSYEKIDYIINEYKSLNIDYIRVFPPSLAKQKNAGVKALNSDITLAGYLDDDMELYPDAIENMIDFWDTTSSDYGGVGFATFSNLITSKVGKIRNFIGIDSNEPGRVFSNGFVSMIENPDKTVEVDWLAGGGSIWRRDIIDNYPYDEWFQGSGFMEDIDYSYSISEDYRLVILAESRLNHYARPIRGDRNYLLGKWQIINRLYFVRKNKHRGASIASARIASISITVVNMLASIYRLDYDRFRMFVGNIVGILISIIKKDVQIMGHLKRKDPSK